MLNLRPQSTRERYKATIKEFRQFCSAKPESVLNGVKLRGNKKVVNDTIETDKVVAFLKDYYTLRSHIRASGASGTCMSYASVKGAVNALRSLQREQLQQGTPQQRDFLKDKPILSEHMPGIRDVLMTAKRRSIAREAEAYYDRAQNTEDIVELSREQKQELAEFGVKVGAPRHQKNWLITGSRFHLVHAFCYVTGVRGDTMRKASLSGM